MVTIRFVHPPRAWVGLTRSCRTPQRYPPTSAVAADAPAPPAHERQLSVARRATGAPPRNARRHATETSCPVPTATDGEGRVVRPHIGKNEHMAAGIVASVLRAAAPSSVDDGPTGSRMARAAMMAGSSALTRDGGRSTGPCSASPRSRRSGGAPAATWCDPDQGLWPCPSEVVGAADADAAEPRRVQPVGQRRQDRSGMTSPIRTRIVPGQAVHRDWRVGSPRATALVRSGLHPSRE
jgi:hypothetical protein